MHYGFNQGLKSHPRFNFLIEDILYSSFNIHSEINPNFLSRVNTLIWNSKLKKSKWSSIFVSGLAFLKEIQLLKKVNSNCVFSMRPSVCGISVISQHLSVDSFIFPAIKHVLLLLALLSCARLSL